MLRQRIITGLCLAALVIAGVCWLSIPQFAVVTALLMGLAAWEWAALVGLSAKGQRICYVLLLLVILLLSMSIISLVLLVLALVVLLWLMAEVYFYAKKSSRGVLPRSLCSQITGILLFTFCWVGLNSLFDAPRGRIWVLYAIVVVVFVDIAGWLIGKRYGRRILCARVSPNKTWEGFWAGIVVMFPISVLGAFALHYSYLPWVYLWLGSMLAAVFALYGDLIESVVKRHVGVKDSGSLLPGHGGILDRIDSMLGAIPVLALLMLGLIFYF